MTDEVRLVSDLLTVAATDTATKLLDVRSDATVKLRKVWLANDSGTASDVYFCDSGKTQLTPKIRMGGYSGGTLGPDEVPAVEFNEDVYVVTEDAQPVEVIIEVEEII